MKSYQNTAIKITVSIIGVAIIVALFYDQFDEVIDIIARSNKVFLLLGLGTYVSANILVALRLRTVLSMNSINLGLLRTWKLNYVGYFFNVFMPSSIGGDIGKGYYAYQYSGKKIESFTAVLMDRMIGLFSVCFLCAFSTLIMYQRFDGLLIPGIVFSFVSFAIGTLILISNKNCARFLSEMHIPFISRKLVQICKKIYVLFHACSKKKTLAIRAFFISVVFQFLSIFGLFMLGLSIGIDVGFITYLLVMPLVYIFSMLPSINGLGVREGAVIFFFSMFFASEKAVALSFLFDLSLYTCSFIGLICYAFHRQGNKRVIKDSALSIDELILDADTKGE